MNNSTRVLVLIGIISVVLVGIGAVGLADVGKSDNVIKSVYQDRAIPMRQVAEIQHYLLTNRLVIAKTLINPVPDEIARNTAEIEANISAITKVWDDYMSTVLTPEESILAKKFTENRTRFVQEGLQPTISALRANDLHEANRLVVEKIGPLFISAGADIQALMSASWYRPILTSKAGANP